MVKLLGGEKITVTVINISCCQSAETRPAEAGSNIEQFAGATHLSIAYLNTRNTKRSQMFLCV